MARLGKTNQAVASENLCQVCSSAPLVEGVRHVLVVVLDRGQVLGGEGQVGGEHRCEEEHDKQSQSAKD
eukprot:CAMPEP_0179271038 /NCGR_PEP_ID=MMETSP0797-20121207/31770_1 /TAXON_ID=47934 /ORGANISM="Dinophysis acuminata, Strain DAEP01" /LENGTH=68 /DNA_ID=CAMNT_0020979379 /DNA_START=195 /DNA_END=402 /DNA_ORIENTATION=-